MRTLKMAGYFDCSFERAASGVPALETKKVNGSDGKSAVEFRCATKEGKTVQDVLPSSIHPDGHQYQWLLNC
jgi:hypothetical protein